VRVARRSQLPGLLTHYESTSVTYSEVGATADVLPPGYRHAKRRTRLGDAPSVFEHASTALMDWRMHRRSGLAVAADVRATEGGTVVLGLGSPVSVVIPCRVIYVVDEPDRQGFAYGTLTDHPEQGEERFMVTRGGRGEAWLEIVAFSRPASRLVAWSGPVNRVAQLRATRRYEDALVQLADG
jgi:uncharacterized protein (UPF0548 family)